MTTEPLVQLPRARPGTRLIRRAVVTIVVVVVAILALPSLVGLALPRAATPRPSGSSPQLPLATERPQAGHVSAPPGWSLTTPMSAFSDRYVFTRQGMELMISGDTDVDGLERHVRRELREASIFDGVSATPDGRTQGPGGLAGPRFRLSGPRYTGELAVLGRGDLAVTVEVLSPDGRPVDLAPFVSALEVTS